MRLSVIVPAYNAASTIGAALESVLRQAVDGLEILVIDDASSDATADMVHENYPSVPLIRLLENVGPAAARNCGIAAASGTAIGFLDADDLWMPEAASVLLAAFDEFPAADVVQGYLQDLWEQPDGAWECQAPRIGYQLGSAVFKRQVFDRVGGFDAALRTGEDTDLWLRVAEPGLTRKVIDAVVMLYRRKSNPDPEARAHHFTHLAHLLKRSLERNRHGDANRADSVQSSSHHGAGLGSDPGGPSIASIRDRGRRAQTGT